MTGKVVKKEEVKAVQEELGSFKEEIKENFRIQVGILSKDFQHKLQLVAEGHKRGYMVKEP